MHVPNSSTLALNLSAFPLCSSPSLMDLTSSDACPCPCPSRPSPSLLSSLSSPPPRLLLVGECPLGLGVAWLTPLLQRLHAERAKTQPLSILSVLEKTGGGGGGGGGVEIYIYIYGSIHPSMEVFYSSYLYSSFSYYYYCKYLHAYMVM